MLSLPAGSYRLSLTNSAEQIATFTVVVPPPNAGQFYSAYVQLELPCCAGQDTANDQFSLTGVGLAMGVTEYPVGYGTVIPAACTVDAIYAWVVGNYLTSYSLTLHQNGVATNFPACQLVPVNGYSAQTTACPLPASPFSVSAGDPLGYYGTSVWDPAGACATCGGAICCVGSINVSLRCR